MSAPGHNSTRTLSTRPLAVSSSRLPLRSSIASRRLNSFDGVLDAALPAAGDGNASASTLSPAMKYFSTCVGDSDSTEPMRSKPL